MVGKKFWILTIKSPVNFQLCLWLTIQWCEFTTILPNNWDIPELVLEWMNEFDKLMLTVCILYIHRSVVEIAAWWQYY